MNALDTVIATSAKLNKIGAIHYFDPGTLAAGKEMGLDGFRFYVLGRGGVLGDVESEVIYSAFSYFAPGLVKKMWNSAKEVVAPRDASRAHLEQAARIGREKFADVEGLDGFNDAAETIVSNAESAALALFAGYQAEPLPDDAPGRAMQNAIALRELRGSVHLVALVASGVDPIVAHCIRRPDDVATFGWDEPRPISDADRQALKVADELTDRLLATHFEVLSDAQMAALAAGTDALAATIG